MLFFSPRRMQFLRFSYCAESMELRALLQSRKSRIGVILQITCQKCHLGNNELSNVKVRVFKMLECKKLRNLFSRFQWHVQLQTHNLNISCTVGINRHGLK